MHSSLRHLIPTCFLAFLTGFSSMTFGQELSQYDKATPPQHSAGVSPLGSYTSTEFGSVNLSNGSLNLKIPLATVGGRGLSIPLTLNYSSKVWSASMDTAVDNQSQSFQAAYADYAQGDSLLDFYQRVGPGWTIGAAPIIFNRIVRINKLPLGGPSGGCYTHTVPKLTVMLPDRGELEFRDDIYDGAPLSSDCGGLLSASRGRRWHATDGSGTIYISDDDNAGALQSSNLRGVVITGDGTRYRFEGMRCTSITDRNGNRIDINYTPSPQKIEYKDQLGRITKLEYFVADPHNPGVTLALLVTTPGYTGNHYIKVKRSAMRNNYRSDIVAPSAVCNGTYDPLSKGYSSWCPGSSPTLLFPHSYGEFMQRIDDLQVVTEVVLPDQRSLRFKYNLFGEVAEAQLPTGGKLWYDYDEGTIPVGNSELWEIGGGFHTEVGEVDRTLVQRRILDGSTLLTTWNYFYSASDVIVTAVSPTEGVLLNKRHLFKPSGRYTDYIGGQGFHDGTHYSIWSTGVEWRTETRNADGTAVLSAVERDWTQRAPVSWSSYAQEQPANDNRVNQERRHLETGLMAKVDTFYDQYNNPIEVKEYDFDQTLKRRTITSYVSSINGFNYQTNDSIHLLALPDTQTVYDGSGNQRAQTVTEYDVYVNDNNHGLLTGYSSVAQHDSSYGINKITRGNPTRVGTWLNTTASHIYTYPRYDIVGNVVAVKDARGNVSTISFADDFGDGSNPGTPTQNPSTPTYALPTLITSPPPTTGAAAHTARSQYNYSTGLLTGFRDRNNVVTQTIYNDPFDRPTQVIAALGISGEQTRTLMYYAPAVTPFGITLAANDVLTARDQSVFADNELRSWTVTDGFGRSKESWSRDPQGDVKVVTTYDAVGRTKQLSNPFRPSLGQTAAYSTTVYDLLGRVKTVTTPDAATVTTSYLANSATVTDQAGKARKSVTDALGRLIEVYEDPGGVNYQTSYLYDALDNLVKVTQGSQQRFFMYDSFKRLIRARNPEQNTHPSLSLSDPVSSNNLWSIGYQYDVNGNLIQKTDARGVVSTYVYDALNRSTTIDHSDTASINPDVKRFYDGATKGKGRFWYSYKGGDFFTGSDVDHTSIDSYDALGRPLVQRQLFKLNSTWSPTYQTSRVYNRAGAVTSQTYPSDRSVAYTYDAAGRTSTFTGNLGDSAQRTYASGITYSQWGSLSREQFGTSAAVHHKLHYNVRGQLFDVRASNVNDEWGGELGALVNYYSTNWLHGGSGPDNNGNVLMSQTIVNSFYVEDRYSYDTLNRLTSVAEFQNGSTPAGSQLYTYDRWGNRTINPSSSLGLNKQFTVDTATNRLGVPGGQTGVMTYDSAGNLTRDTYTGAGDRLYDADNKMTAAQDNAGAWSHYTYNADGQRVRRKINNQETWQIYGLDGELLAEYPANGPSAKPSTEYGYRNGQLLVTAEVAKNVALASSGATVTASSTLINPPYSYPVTAMINGDRKGLNAGFGGNWAGSSASLPQWVQVDFNGSKTISEINVFSLQDNYPSPLEPTETTAFSLYGLTAFQVQYWNGSAWVMVPGGSVTGNNKVWKKLSFAPLTTTKIRVVINATSDNWTRVVEVEAWTDSGGPAGASINWLVTDHLGTPRMVIEQTGSLANVKRHDYLPFGEELFANVGGRSAGNGYTGSDNVRQQFTAKERDVETGLDYFLARYYGSTQGRFTSVDPMPIKKRHLIDPQDLNRYAYVANNPLKYIDPEGLEKIVVIVRTFIPAEKITHPPGVGATFKGDYNSKGERISARTEHRMVVETDAKRTNSNNFENSPTVGRTERLARGMGSVRGPSEGSASGDSMKAGLTRINDNSVRLDVKGDEANPLVTGSPGITYRFNITVSSEGEKGRASVGVSGQHDGFPAYEIEVMRPDSGGTSTKVYQHDPNKTGDGAQSLYGSGEYYPEVKVVIEPKKKP